MKIYNKDSIGSKLNSIMESMASSNVNNQYYKTQTTVQSSETERGNVETGRSNVELNPHTKRNNKLEVERLNTNNTNVYMISDSDRSYMGNLFIMFMNSNKVPVFLFHQNHCTLIVI